MNRTDRASVPSPAKRHFDALGTTVTTREHKKGDVFKHSRIALLILFLGLCSGCMSTKLYSGPKRPLSEVAVIRVQRGLVKIMKVDNKLIWGQYCEVLPGNHVIEWKYRTNKSYANGTIKFFAYSGRFYEPFYDTDMPKAEFKRKVRVTISDITGTSGAVIKRMSPWQKEGSPINFVD